MPKRVVCIREVNYQEVDHVDSIMKYDYEKIKYLDSRGYRFGQPTLIEMNPAQFLKLAPLSPALTSESSF